MAAPALDHDPGLGQAVEDLAVQELVAKLGVEARSSRSPKDYRA